MTKIEQLLNEQERSIYWLAQSTGISYDAVHRIVRADAIPPRTHYATLRQMADALGVKIDDLEPTNGASHARPRTG